MKNMSLIFGAAMAVCLALVFSSCESPTDGSSGAPGQDSPVTLNGPAVSAADLAAVFKVADRALLLPGVTTVVGEIPAGKTLIVSGPITTVSSATYAATDALAVEGTLEIFAGATLDASGISSTSGILKGTGAVTGDGAVALPFVKKTDLETYELANPGVLTYLSSNVNAAGKYVGSARSSGILAALTATSIQTIFELSGEDAIDALTASDIKALTAATIPAGKTLTLIGAGNEFAAALDLGSAGNLVVKGKLSLASSASTATTITGDATTANITIAPEGTLALGEHGRIAGKIENNGTITSGVTTGPEQGAIISLAGLSGSGTVVLSGTGTTAAGTATLALAQDVEISGKLIAPTIATPFSGTKTITVASGGILDLGATVTTLTGATIVNGGTVSTATTTTAALNTILAIGGTITSAGDVAGTDNITVPADTIFTHDSGTFVGGTGTLTIDGTATFTTGTFASQTGKLTVNGTAEFTVATFDTLTSLEVDGDAKFTVATFAALTTLTVNGDLTAGAATFGALTTISGTGSVTAGDVPKAGVDVFLANTTLGSVNLGTTTYGTSTDTLTIPAEKTIIFYGDLAPVATVEVNGTLVIYATGSLTLKNALTFGTNGALALVAGAEVTLGDASAAKITGGTTYEIVTDGSSTTGTLTAGEAVVVFTASTISGMADEDTPAAATLAFGAADSVLTVKANMEIAALTLDVATKGKITVAAGQKLTLKYVEGEDGVLSGAIFTKAISSGTAGGAVKANAATPQTSTGAIANAAALAAAKVEAKAAANVGTGDLGTGATATDPADGAITGAATGTSIETANTFAVASGVITVS